MKRMTSHPNPRHRQYSSFKLPCQSARSAIHTNRVGRFFRGRRTAQQHRECIWECVLEVSCQLSLFVPRVLLQDSILRPAVDNTGDLKMYPRHTIFCVFPELQNYPPPLPNLLFPTPIIGDQKTTPVAYNTWMYPIATHHPRLYSTFLG